MMHSDLFSAIMEVAEMEAYFTRIGYSGPADATLETLQLLHRLHPQAIAFENLDPLFARLPVLLDTPALVDKLVANHRGGYCFEHNLLLGHVLSSIGFHVSGLASRILWNQPEDAAPPRSHMLLRVELDGEDYIADVGFGGLTLTAPLRLWSAGREQATPHERFRIVEDNGLFRLDGNVQGEWKPIYRFDLQEQVRADLEISNYYLSAHSQSHFRKTLIAARPFAGGRHALLGNRLTTRTLDGRTERRILGHADQLRDVLSELFLIEVPQGHDAILAAAVEHLGAD